MRIINRYGPGKAAIFRLTIWRRALVALICFMLTIESYGEPTMMFLFGFAGMVALVLTFRAIYIKARVSTWS